MAMTFDEAMAAIRAQIAQNSNGGEGQYWGDGQYKVPGIDHAIQLNGGVGYSPEMESQGGSLANTPYHDFTPYYYDPNSPKNKVFSGKDGDIPNSWKTIIGKNADGSLNLDGGYYSNGGNWFDKLTTMIPAIGAMAMGGAALGPAGAGLWGGAPAAGVGALEAGATMFPGEVAGFGYGGLGSAAVPAALEAGTTMFPGEAAGFGYGGAESALSGTMFPGEVMGGDYFGGQAATSGISGGSLLSSLGDIAGSKIGSSLLGAAIGGLGGSGDKELTQTQQSNIDPRMASILYGADGKSGFINDILTAGKGGLKGGLGSFGQYADDYLGTNGLQDMGGMRSAANQLMSGNIDAPQMKGANPVQASLIGAAQINAPSQNNTDLSAAYQDMIYGQPGNNPYLTGGIQKGINQANTAFQNMQTDATRNLTENILPSIRSGAQVNGQYGGSRQALSEGKALNDYSTQIGRAMSQVGQNNTDSAIAARAGAYNTDRSNTLSAMSGLGAQQYGVATNNAQMQQQANAQNANFLNDASRTNAGLQQQTQQSNLQSQIGTNSLNSANKATGINAQSGLLGQAYNYGTNNDMYGLNKIGKTSGMLGQYTGLGGSQTSSQPLYENKMGNILGGATAGLGLYNAYKDLTKKDNTGGLFDSFRFNGEY